MTLSIEFICNEFLRGLKNGVPVEDELIKVLMKKPFIPELRKLIEPKDKKFILSLMNSDVQITRTLGVSLSKHIEMDEHIRDALNESWEICTDYETRFNLMYRLLDDKEADEEIINVIYMFVRENMERWRRDVIAWEGGKDRILENVQSRYKKHPKHKTWVYLYELFWAPEKDKPEAKAIIEEFKNSDYHLNKKVALEILEEL